MLTNMSLVADQTTEVTEEDRLELQSHFPYAGVKLSELSVQEERLILYFLRGMSKAAAGRAAGYRNQDSVYEAFKRPKIVQAIEYLREEMREIQELLGRIHDQKVWYSPKGKFVPCLLYTSPRPTRPY